MQVFSTFVPLFIPRSAVYGLLIGLMLSLVLSTVTRAQSRSRRDPPYGRRQPDAARAREGSATRQPPTERTARLAMEGYCPVCLRDQKRWVRGNAAHRVEHDGRTYHFASEEQRQTFLAQPARYVPVLGGDCVVCYAKMGERVPANIRYGKYYQDRLYFFASPEQMEMFVEDPRAFSDVDLAMGGACPVCWAQGGQRIAGDPRIETTYAGLRYRFPTAEMRDVFLASPEKYRVR